jgi:hypothetical protein
MRILFINPDSTWFNALPSCLEKDEYGVLEALDLPSWTLSAMQSAPGMLSTHTLPEGASRDTCSRLGEA